MAMSEGLKRSGTSNSSPRRMPATSDVILKAGFLPITALNLVCSLSVLASNAVQSLLYVLHDLAGIHQGQALRLLLLDRGRQESEIGMDECQVTLHRRQFASKMDGASDESNCSRISFISSKYMAWNLTVSSQVPHLVMTGLGGGNGRSGKVSW